MAVAIGTQSRARPGRFQLADWHPKWSQAIRETEPSARDITGNISAILNVFPDDSAPIASNSEGRASSPNVQGTRSPHFALIASNFDQGVANAVSSRRREQMLGRVHKLRRLPNRVTDAIALAISQTAYEEFDFRINGPVEQYV